MTDQYWDDVANEAVNRLADELAPALRNAISDALTDALARLGDDVSRQNEEIEIAVGRVRQAVATMAGDFNEQATAAFMKGLAADVLPALRDEGVRARRAGDEHFASVLQGIAELLRVSFGDLQSVLKLEIRPVKDQFRQSIDGLLGEKIASITRAIQASKDALAETEKRLSHGNTIGFTDLEKRVTTSEGALQSAVKEFSERSGKQVSGLKDAIEKHGTGLIEEMRRARSESTTATEMAKKSIVSSLESLKAEVLNAVTNTSRALSAEIAEHFGLLDTSRARIEENTRLSLQRQEQLLKQLRAAAIFISLAVAGMLMLLTYRVLH